MVEIQSKEVIDKMSDELKVQPALLLPRELGKMIVPTFEVNPPRNIIIKTGSASDTATAATIYTTDIKKRTFLSTIHLSVTKDASAAGTNTRIVLRTREQGVLQLILLQYEPTTAGSFVQTLNFPFPLELQKGAVVEIKHDNATASIDGIANIFFFETDPQ